MKYRVEDIMAGTVSVANDWGWKWVLRYPGTGERIILVTGPHCEGLYELEPGFTLLDDRWPDSVKCLLPPLGFRLNLHDSFEVATAKLNRALRRLPLNRTRVREVLLDIGGRGGASS